MGAGALTVLPGGITPLRASGQNARIRSAGAIPEAAPLSSTHAARRARNVPHSGRSENAGATLDLDDERVMFDKDHLAWS
jgi:hypothetical protein